MAKLNAATKSVLANIFDGADTVSRFSLDNRMITARRNRDEVIKFCAIGDFAWIEAEVEHPDDGSIYSAYVESDGDGLNGAITSLLAKLTHDSLTFWREWYPKSLLAWMLGINE